MLMPTRPQTIAWRILLRHTEFCEGLADALIEKCQGNDEKAEQMINDFFKEFGKYDFELERYLDFGLCVNALSRLFKLSQNRIEF